MSKQSPQDLARQRAEIILQVRSGQLSATQAASQLGISRKSYYQWEQRAFKGMLEALETRSPGRPPAPQQDLETRRLRQQVEELENRLKLLTEVQQLRAMLPEPRASKPTPLVKRSPRRPPPEPKKKA